jgi:hypothetical protein
VSSERRTSLDSLAVDVLAAGCWLLLAALKSTAAADRPPIGVEIWSVHDAMHRFTTRSNAQLNAPGYAYRTVLARAAYTQHLHSISPWTHPPPLLAPSRTWLGSPHTLTSPSSITPITSAMSQLAVRPGRNAARQAKKLKEIRHVKGAIVWHERERAKRQKAMQERWESKQAAISRIKWENDNVKRVRTQALERVREDWRLGALRPNRAAGAAADKYGALSTEQLQKPEIPIHTLKNRNEFRAKRGLAQEYPLVVDDKKYFHLERDDRVVVINGREKGKIGLVQSIVPRTHEVIVKGVNLVRRKHCTLLSPADGI